MYFYPRSPCGERHDTYAKVLRVNISIHALLAESDFFHAMQIVIIVVFLSTLSLRRATLNCSRKGFAIRYFYPRSPCGERPRQDLINGIRLVISIHALLAESDGTGYTGQQSAIHFYPRSPCGERRVTVLGIQHRTGISIHALLAESDTNQTNTKTNQGDFYPRSPCGERPTRIDTGNSIGDFYPRSPCGERPL